MYPNNYVPPMLSPINTYTGDTAPAQGSVVAAAKTPSAGSVAAAAKPADPSPASTPVVVPAPDTPKVAPPNNSPSPSPSPIPSPVPAPPSDGYSSDPKNATTPGTPPVVPPPRIEQPGGDGRDHHCPKKSQHNKRHLRRSHDSGDFSVAF
jgi:hypothetical protein